MKIKPMWIALGVVAALGFATVGNVTGQRSFNYGGYLVTLGQNDESDGGAWFWQARLGGVLAGAGTPFASEAAARGAAQNWIDAQGQQGGVAPPIVPPIPQAPYLQIVSGSVQGSALARTDGVTWRVTGGAGGTQTGAAANALVGGRDLLTAMDIAVPVGQPVTLEYRRADGSIVRARVARGAPPMVDWTWATFTPAPAGGVSVSSSQAGWRSASRLGAMRGALATLQGL